MYEFNRLIAIIGVVAAIISLPLSNVSSGEKADSGEATAQSQITLEGVSPLVTINNDGRSPVHFNALLIAPLWTAESNQAGANFGWPVASAGDVNGDGYEDIIIGANKYDDTVMDEGRVYVYYGGPLGPEISPSWMAEGNQWGACFGISVAGIGDVNGDEYDDVIIGAHGYNKSAAETNTGRAFVYLGSEEGLADTPCWTADGDQIDCYLGFSVAGAGDVNGDGYDDIIIGAPGYDDAKGGEGRAYVYYGGVSGPSATPSWVGIIDQERAHFGRSVAGAGDVNKDGYDDVIVGGFMDEDNLIDQGTAYVFLGSDTGVVDTPCWTADDEQVDTGFGLSVAGAGDVNGDGYDDVIVGAYAYDNGEFNEGTAYVFYGSDSGTVDTCSWMAESDQESAWFGFSVAGVGDVTCDGYDDVMVGAYGYDNGQSNEGRAYIYCGGLAGLSATPIWTTESNQNYARLGVSVAAAGDVNRDGYGEVIIGALDYSDQEVHEGKAYVYSFCDCIAVMLQQYASTWQGDHAEVTWILADASTSRNLTFEITRRKTPGEPFTLINNPDIVREGNQFTLRDRSVEPGRAYTYRVAIFEDGRAAASFEVDLETPAQLLALHQNHPNPFNPVTTIGYSLPSASYVTLEIYDVSGRRIARLVNEAQKGGAHTIEWAGLDEKGNPVSSGTYIYRLKAGKEVISRKMILLR
ncbi:MAG: FG-GAP-like repeat-containing protein [Candidatus Krumholzibacteria bacterium]|nr:FG-GAP-like repeat-containing protein [Candidatus Krumholzibacteria bacterium]